MNTTVETTALHFTANVLQTAPWRLSDPSVMNSALISEAIRHGDCHKPTMEMADFWLLEKGLVHKLFKVLAPRFENSNLSFTKMYKAPKPQYSRNLDKAVLELRGNPYPDLHTKQANNKLWIQNVLLEAAKHDYRQSKYAEIAQNIGKNEQKSQDKSDSPNIDTAEDSKNQQ